MRNVSSTRLIISTLVLSAWAAALHADDLNLPAEKIAGGKAGSMLHRYLMGQVDQRIARWRAEYEQRKTPGQIAAHQKRLRALCLESIGGLPSPTPLEPRITGTVERNGYRVEKIIFASQPRHYVTALLFLPDAKNFRPPYPGVLVPCGHAQIAKGHDTYQSMGALLALNGMAALVFDPIDQGERGQYLGKNGWPTLWGTRAHSLVGVACILLGRNTARFEIFDAMRAIDYLQSRPEVDPKRIGCTGNSGGGTQTSYIMALDDRIRTAAPSCYITSLQRLLATIGPQDAEQHFFGQLDYGAEHADLITMRAPSPVLILAATSDFFDITGVWDSFRAAKRLYTRMGFADRVDVLENDAGHNYNELQRDGALRWMSRWLLGKEPAVRNPTIRLLDAKEYQCTPGGQVMLLEGARSIYDLNDDYEKELAQRRAAIWNAKDRSAALERVRKLAGIRSLADLPRPRAERIAVVARPGYSIEQLLLTTEPGVDLPALLFLPHRAKPGRGVLYLHEAGKAVDAGPNGPIVRLVEEGATVLAVDLRGVGQTRPGGPGTYPQVATETQDFYIAYLLGRSYVGMRAEDVLVCARHLQERIGGPPTAIDLIAVGNVGIPALHAAALENSLFSGIRLSRTLAAWSGIVRNRLHEGQLAGVIHGALTHYDLPDLAATLGNRLTIEAPQDPLGRPIVAKP
jgi:dienelactone hydrolase